MRSHVTWLFLNALAVALITAAASPVAGQTPSFPSNSKGWPPVQAVAPLGAAAGDASASWPAQSPDQVRQPVQFPAVPQTLPAVPPTAAPIQNAPQQSLPPQSVT